MNDAHDNNDDLSKTKKSEFPPSSPPPPQQQQQHVKKRNNTRRKRSRSRSRSYGPSSHHNNHNYGGIFGKWRRYLPYMPIIYWLPAYKNGWRDRLRGDLVGALTVACMLVPQAMSYALLAGVPPIYGLYAGSIPLIVYSTLGTSRIQAVGPTAVDSLMCYSTMASILSAEQLTDPVETVKLATTLAFTSGLMLTLMGAFRMGVLVNFLSYSVMAGFTTAAALIILTSQMQYLVGVHNVPRYVGPGGRIRQFYYVLSHLNEINWWTVWISCTSIVFLVYTRRWKRARKRALAERSSDGQTEPEHWSRRYFALMCELSALVVTIVGTLWTYILHLSGVRVASGGDGNYVAVVGDVPPGLLAPKFPPIGEYMSGDFGSLMFGSFVIALVAFMELYSIGKVYAEQRRYRLDANQEMVALGTTNVCGSILHAFPIGGSFSRTAVNADSGARTLLSNAVAGVLTLFALMFLSKLFFYVPMACLGSIISVAVQSLMKIEDFKMARRYHRTSDLWVMWVTFIVTVATSIQYGIALGVVLSMVVTLNHSAFPPMPELGQVPGKLQFRDIRNERNAVTFSHTFIVRLDAELYYANTDKFRSRLMRKARSGAKAIVVDASTMISVDLQGIIMLRNLINDLHGLDVSLYFASLRGSPRRVFRRAGLSQLVGADHIFIELSDAVFAAVQSTHGAQSMPENMVSTSMLMKSYESAQADLDAEDDIDESSSASSSSSDDDSDIEDGSVNNNSNSNEVNARNNQDASPTLAEVESSPIIRAKPHTPTRGGGGFHEIELDPSGSIV